MKTFFGFIRCLVGFHDENQVGERIEVSSWTEPPTFDSFVIIVCSRCRIRYLKMVQNEKLQRD